MHLDCNDQRIFSVSERSRTPGSSSRLNRQGSASVQTMHSQTPWVEMLRALISLQVHGPEAVPLSEAPSSIQSSSGVNQCVEGAATMSFQVELYIRDWFVVGRYSRPRSGAARVRVGHASIPLQNYKFRRSFSGTILYMYIRRFGCQLGMVSLYRPDFASEHHRVIW